MTKDLTAVWDSFVCELNPEIKRVSTAVLQTYAKICKIAASPAANGSRATEDTGIAMRTFALTLLRRERLICEGIEQAIEAFVSALISLRTDTVTSIKTAFIAKLMKDTYHAANIEHGNPALSSASES